MKWVELFIGLGCVLIVAMSLGVGGVKAARNPTHDRLANFELELAAVTYVTEEYVTESDADYDAIVSGIVRKSTLWKELVPPPPPPKVRPKPVKKPNFAKMLQNVLVSKRMWLIEPGGRLVIQVKTKENRRGSWMGAGDEVNGVTIKKINEKNVVFSFRSNNKEYTYSLPRR